VEENEMTKLFLRTLSPFYYEKMVGSASRSFAEMVGVGVSVEEGVREGRIVKDGASISSAKKYDNNFPKKEQEVCMVTSGRAQQHYPAYQHVATITPATNAIQQPLDQPHQPYQ
jgi:hypothetical protein